MIKDLLFQRRVFQETGDLGPSKTVLAERVGSRAYAVNGQIEFVTIKLKGRRGRDRTPMVVDEELFRPGRVELREGFHAVREVDGLELGHPLLKVVVR